MEAAGDGSSQLTGEHICLGRAIMQDLVPCQPAVERKSECVLRMRMCVTERDCVCVCVCAHSYSCSLGCLKDRKPQSEQ